MTVLAAVDGDRSPDPVIEVAHDLATAYGDPLAVVHVMPNETFDERQEGQASYSLEQAESGAAEVARRVVRNTLEDADDVSAHGVVGNVATQVIEMADELNARYLVVGGRKRTPVGKALFGSVTQSILLHAELPVMTVMTDD